MIRRTSHAHPADGFTLPEIMVATAVLSVLVAIFMSVYLDTSRIAFTSDERNQINRDIRTVTSELSQFARASNYFLLYSSFAEDDRDDSGDQLQEGNSGDLLVLVYQGEPKNLQITTLRPIVRIVGYYRAPADPLDPRSFGPVRKFDLAIDEDDQEKPLETLLPDASLIGAFPQVIELSEGLASGKLFYNLWGRSVMINGKIIHGNTAKRVTDTYNFTVSPRGQQG